jgi:hypothetical protein
MTPPPSPTRDPSRREPTMSKFRRAARRQPDMAKKNVPKRSSISRMSTAASLAA